MPFGGKRLSSEQMGKSEESRGAPRDRRRTPERYSGSKSGRRRHAINSRMPNQEFNVEVRGPSQLAHVQDEPLKTTNQSSK
jgi:hypothetical protein